jgi:uncharacterized membrane protein
MKQKLVARNHSMKMMWGCVALVLVAVIVGLTSSAYVLLFVLPCVIMMGAMMWMMMRGGMGGGGAK